MILTGQSLLAGVLGWPVAHSLSPRLHGYWLRKHEIDGAYLPLPVRTESFGTAVNGLVACGFRGVNVTVPHKQAAMELCARLETSAQRSGAVNTLMFGADGVVGSNTDGQGFLRSLHDRHVDPTAGLVLILGAGGAARAIAAALLDAGAHVAVASRRAAQADDLAGCLSGLETAAWPAHRLSAHVRLLINATTGGMTGLPGLDVNLGGAAPDLVVADIVYAPRRTVLLALAESMGLKTVDGIDMLLHQAVFGFQGWFGVTPVVDAELRDFMLSG